MNIKKWLVAALMVGTIPTVAAQYMIIGKDSISLQQFKKDYKYGLENAGIEKTIKSTQDFYLYQQFAADHKADTLTTFRQKMAEKEAQLVSTHFFPAKILDPVLQQYVKDNQTERKVQVFIVEKKPDDKINYQQVYNDVKSGKISIAEAISKYTTNDAEPIFVKAGTLDDIMYSEIKSLPNNSLTKFYDTPSYFGFAKVIDTRPSLGYMIFGTISFANDGNAEDIKNKIYTDLKSGKKFQEVAKLYGANDHEKNNGGVVMGSPTLPDEVYALFKGKEAGYYTPEPLLFGDKYFVFNLYNVEPYTLTDNNRNFFLREMNNSLYADLLQDKMVAYLKSDPGYKEFPAFANAKKSFANFDAAKDADLLYQFKNERVTVGDLRKLMGDKKEDAMKLSPAAWTEVMTSVNAQDVIRMYSAQLAQSKELQQELQLFKRGLYSDYIFSTYVSQELAKHPEWFSEYYNKNKDKFQWGERADGRVAIIADPKLVKSIAKEIKDPKDWDALKAKYAGKLNAEKQVLVSFEIGEMMKDAEIFTKYHVTFKPGVHETKMGARTVVIAIDKILPPSQMTLAEANNEIKDALTEQKLNEIITQQRAKTKITIQPEFLKDLEKNFKK